MTCAIKKNGHILIRRSTSIFESLYHEINDIVEQEEVETNDEFNHFMNELDHSVFTMGGVAPDIGHTFTQSANLDILILLLERVIYILRSQVQTYVVEDLWKLHAALIKYKEELVAQGR